MTPLLEPPPYDRSVMDACLDAVAHVAQSGRFVGGLEVERFADSWAAATGTGRCVPVGNGTDALFLILRALRERHPKRDRVVVPATTFVATAESAVMAGLRPVACDVDDRGLMDPEAAEAAAWKVGPARVLAIVPVHLYGQTADVAAAESLCRTLGIPHVVEDACQAHGARYGPGDGPPVGSRHPAAWSFMPAKVLGAWGDAGAATFPRGADDLAARVASLANHARTSHTDHDGPGVNSRMDAVQAAVLNVLLPRLRTYRNLRRGWARWYADKLSELPLRLQPDRAGRTWSYFAVWAASGIEQLALTDHLLSRNVGVGRHYPYSLPPAAGEETPVAERLAQTTLTLPLWPGMSTAEAYHVVESVAEFFGG